MAPRESEPSVGHQRYSAHVIRHFFSAAFAGAAVVLGGMASLVSGMPAAWLVSAGVAAIVASLLAADPSKKNRLVAPSIKVGPQTLAIASESKKTRVKPTKFGLSAPRPNTV